MTIRHSVPRPRGAFSSTQGGPAQRGPGTLSPGPDHGQFDALVAEGEPQLSQRGINQRNRPWEQGLVGRIDTAVNEG